MENPATDQEEGRTRTRNQVGSRPEQTGGLLPTEERHAAAATAAAAAAAAAAANAGATAPRYVSRPASIRSTTSVNARLRQSEYEAERRLMEIKRKELQMEAELIKKKLAWETAVIQDDNESVVDHTNMEDRVDNWLNQHSSTMLAEPESGRVQDSAQRRDPSHVRGEPERNSPSKTQGDQRRRRSPTPGRHRGVDRLADLLQQMVQVRPRPRQATELPYFTGAAAEWLPFKAAMKETSETYQFTPTENIARLRNCLKGEARESVSALLATTADPNVIMRTLEQCYGRPEVIIDQALEQMRRLSRPGPAASELNNFAIKLQNIVCVLMQVDRRGYQSNPMLAREVVSKLSPHVAARWCDYAEEHGSYTEPEIVTLSKFLMREADRALRHAYSPATGSFTKVQDRKEERRTRPPAGPVRRAATHNVTETSNKVRSCCCCKGEHNLTMCKKFIAMSKNDRWQLVKKEQLCFRCMLHRHRRTSCDATPCGIDDCRRPHHRLLHTPPPPAASPEPATANEVKNEQETVATTVSSSGSKQVLLKVCPVMIKGPEGEVKAYALLDEGSTISLIDKELARGIRAEGPTQNIHLHGVNTVMRERESQRIKVQVRGINTGYFDLEARTIDGINLRGQAVPETVLEYPHLRKLDAKEVCYDMALPKLLIGADHWHLIVTRQILAGRRAQPVAARTSLGWVILGNTPKSIFREDHATVVHLQMTESSRFVGTDGPEEERLDDLIKEHYAIDALGVSLKTKPKAEDERAIEIVKRTTRLVEGRYEVGLPWRRDNVTMPPSYSTAVRRLTGIEKKMDKDPAFAAEYSAQIENLLKKSYAVPADGTEEASSKQWYLPHFAVRNPNKPGKIRLVFDAAATTNDTSLNQDLLEGPDLLTSLQGILYRFRENPIAVTADIQEMFLQIKIRKEDQPAQMFLWRGQDRRGPPQKYKMTSMIFGAASSPFIAHSVRNMNAEAHAHSHPGALKAITESHYMDDYVDSYDDEEEAVRVTKSVADVHAKAGFLLRSWNSNSEKVLAAIPEEL